MFWCNVLNVWFVWLSICVVDGSSWLLICLSVVFRVVRFELICLLIDFSGILLILLMMLVICLGSLLNVFVMVGRVSGVVLVLNGIFGVFFMKLNEM